MKNIIKSRLLAIFALILSVCMLIGTVGIISKNVAKAENTTDIASLADGASIRVIDPNETGIKFKAQLDRARFNALYNEYDGNVKAGMMIVPTDYITAAEGYTFSAFQTKGLKVGFKTTEEYAAIDGSTLEFTMSLVNLRLANYDRDFEAIVYIEIDNGEQLTGYDWVDNTPDDGVENYKNYQYVARDTSAARNIYDVAKGVYKDRTASEDSKHKCKLSDGTWATLDDSGMAIAKSYIDGVTEIVLDGEGKPAAYSDEYYAAKDSVLTNDSEVYLMGEHANVVYNGKSVTSYPYTADGITIKEMYESGATYANGEYTMKSNGVATTGSNLNSFGLVLSNATYDHIAFDGKYGPSTYVEFTFTGNNMPNVILFSDDVESKNFTRAGGRGMAFLNGVTTDGGTTGIMNHFSIYGPARMNQHFAGYAAYEKNYVTSAPTMQYFINNSTTEFRYVVGTYIVKEDVHNASGVIYGEEDEKDGELENVIWFDLYIYNNETGVEVVHLTDRLMPKNVTGITDWVTTAKTEYLLAEDFVDGGIMAYPAFKGKDANEDIITSTFKVTKAPYHVHNFTELTSGNEYHWYECDCGAASEKVAHTGGKATHTEQAKCEVCGTPYGDLRANYDVDDVKLVQMTNKSATEVITADKGALTFSPEQATPSQTNTSSIVLKKQYTTEFVKVGFTALADYVKEGTVTNLISVLGLSIEYRTTSETSVHGYDQWGILIKNDTNYFDMHCTSSGNHRQWPSTRSVSGAMTAGETYYIIAGITEAEGDKTLHFYIIDKNNTVIGKAIATQDNITAAETSKADASEIVSMPTSGFWTINSWASSERTVSWETISEAQAMYHINGGKGVEGLTVSGNVAEWTGYDGATSYKVKVNDGEWDTVNTNTYAMTGLKAFNTYNVTVKAICDGFETKETTTSFQYIPSDVAFTNVDMATIKADGELSATKGKVTMTTTVTPGTQSAAAITLKQNFTNQFIKVDFTALGTYEANVTNLDAALGISIGFRRTAVATTNPLSDWVATPIWNTNFWSVYKGTGLGTAMVNVYSAQTSISKAAWTTVTAGVNYSLILGITGTSTDRTLHLIWLDESNNVLRYLSCPEAFFTHKYSDVEMPNAGYFTIHSWATGERTISYEIIEAEDVFKNANYGSIETTDNKITHSGATITWPTVANATNYAVRVNDGAWETVATNSYTIANPVTFTNYEVEIRANLGYYAATGTYSFIYTPTGISVLNMTGVSSTGTVNTTSGNLTFTHDGEMSTANAATVVLDGNYTSDQFIKVGFTALESAMEGSTRVLCPLYTYGVAVGVRAKASADPRANLSVIPRHETNWVDIFNVKVPAHSGYGDAWVRKNGHFDAIVKGDQLYIVTGVVGTGTDAVMTWILLKNDTLLASWQLTADKITAAKSGFTIADTGCFTIHSIGSGERTISYELISSTDALALLG